ncbi:unnamed protein product [Rotaria sp. Silwood1]|nr:unnamed protein product [Rotaria sp. Silwood1]
MPNFVQTQQYESSSESDDTMDQQNVQEKTKIKRNFDWIRDKCFSNDTDAQIAIKREEQWSRYFTNKVQDGVKVHYRCNKVKFRGTQCNAAIYLFYPHNSDEVILFRANNEHNHTDSSKRYFFSEEMKQNIQELFDMRLKPKKIYEVLEEKNFKITRNQVNNYLTQLRKQKFGPSSLSLGELESWCQEKHTVPQSDDESFVVSFHIHYEDDSDDDDEDVVDDGNKFRFFLSSKRLLQIASISTKLHADATYKLNWQGFPVLVVGTSDCDRKFHPFGLAVCTDEKEPEFEFIFKSISDGVNRITGSAFTPEVLIADGSGAIRNAFQKFFNRDKMVMCWSHMRRNVEKKLKSLKIDSKKTKEILDDIETLQLCESETVFRNVSSLFLKQWNKTEKEFTEYFENEWLTVLDSWYEGYNGAFTPSTNNQLEATNKVIKDEHTFRERHTLSRFLTVASDIVNKWSMSRNQNQTDPVVFSTEPTIPLAKWTNAYHFAKSSKSVLQLQSKRKGFIDYYIPAGDVVNITKNEIQRYQRQQWTSFAQFKDLQFGIWKVTLPNIGSEWKNGFCNCPNFLKEYICKHVIGMAIGLKHCKPPSIAKDVPLGEKRKRGRPRKATQALLID